MCGRFTLRTPIHLLADQFAAILEAALEPRFNIGPRQLVAAVRARPETAPLQRHLAALRWGLVPSWAKDLSVGNRLINARAETVAEKPAFRAAFRLRRCLLPADGFFEWQRRGEGKQPYYIQMADERPFAFAGLWEAWEGAGHDCVESCTIVTTSANRLIAPIHDRMPVILAEESYRAWLDPAADPNELKSLLVPFDALRLKVHPVSRYVNRPGNEGPGCIAPLAL
ncbi:MAG: SOS response-associated peptidase [Pirellulales bacterium]|nr:SOS response-associated peptidase [Pirellulales bacterium]